jgi:hypothetical protein
VDLPYSSFPYDSLDVLIGDSATRHDDWTFASLLNQLAQYFSPFDGRLCTARRQDPVRPSFHHLLQRPEKIGGHIEGPMIGHLNGPRQIDQCARPLNVDIRIRVQNSEYDAISP